MRNADHLPQNAATAKIIPKQGGLNSYKWLDDRDRPDSDIRDHVRDRWNGSEEEFPVFAKAVEAEFEKQTNQRKKTAEIQQSIQKAGHAAFVDRVSGGKD